MKNLKKRTISILLIVSLVVGLMAPGAMAPRGEAIALTSETGTREAGSGIGEESFEEEAKELTEEDGFLPKDVVSIRPYSEDPVAAVSEWGGIWMYAKKGQPGIYKDLTFRAKLDDKTATVRDGAYTKHYGKGIYVWRDENTGAIYAHNDLALEYSSVKIDEATFTKNTHLSLHLKGFIYREEKEGFNTKEIRYSEKGKPLFVWEIDEEGKRHLLHEAKYNDFGSMIWEKDAAGYEITYIYEDVKDKKGKKTGDRLLGKSYSDGTSDKYEYDDKGRLIKHINVDGTIEEFAYDGEDRLIRHTTYDSKREKKLLETVTRYEEKITTEYPDHYVVEKETNEDTITGALTESTKEYDVYKAIGKVKKKDKEEQKKEEYTETVVKKQKLKDGSYKETERVVYKYVHEALSEVIRDGKRTTLTYSGDHLVETRTYEREDGYEKLIEATEVFYDYYKDEKGEYTLNIKSIKEKDKNEAITIYEYDIEGNMTCYEDGYGNRTYYEYNKEGQVTKITSPKGNEIRYEYDRSGRLGKIIDAKGGETYLIYDDGGRLIEEREEEGGKILSYASYEYDIKGRVKAERDIEGKIVAEYTYDVAGNVTSIKDGRGNIIEMNYDALGNLTSTKAATGEESFNVYDEKGNLIEKIDENGNISKIEYDEFGNIVKTIDREGNEITFTYDAKGRQISTLEGEKLTRFEYDEAGNLSKVIEGNGAETESKYDSRGNVIYTKDPIGGEEERGYDALGNLKWVEDGKGNKTEFFYDSENFCWKKLEYMDGKAMRETFYEYDESGNVIEVRVTDIYENTLSKVEMEYDAAGRVIEERNILSKEGSEENKVRYEYDTRGRVTKVIYEDGESHSLYEYDESGNVSRESYVGKDGKTYEYIYSYNENNQLVSMINPAKVQTVYTYTPVGMIETEEILDEAGNRLAIISYSYDKNDNVKEVKENDILKLKYDYDEMGRVIAEEDAGRNRYLYTYDEVGNLTKVIYPDGGEESYEYDHMSRVAFATDSEGGKVGYIYDEASNVIATIDQRGYIHLESYDGFGRKTLTVEADENSKAEYIYDEKGRVKEVRLGEVTLAEYIYDEKGHLINAKAGEGYKEVISREEKEDKDIVRYEYDLLDRLIRVIDKDKVETLYEYDAKGRLTKESIKKPGEEAKVTGSYEYDVFDRIISETDAKGVERKYEYDSLGNVIKYIDGLKRVTEYTYNISGNLIKEKDYSGRVYEYGYDALSRLISEKDPLGKSIFYEYDKEGNLWKVTDRKGNVTSYFYDILGNLKRTEDAMKNVTILEYDSMGRVTAAKVQRGEGEEEKDFDITRYEYDKRGLLVKETDPLGNEKSYTYDEAGNLVASVNEEGEETSFTYNYMNLLETAVYPKGERVSYAYDSFGNMIGAKNSRGTVTIERDYLGRITGVKDENGKNVGYSYDDLGNLTEITYPEGEKVWYSYDEEGRLKEAKDSLLGSFTIIHDDKAGTVTKNYANGEKTVYTFDKAGNVTGLKEYLKDKSLYMDIEYGYDENGNRTKEKYNVFEGEKGQEGKAAKENTYVYDSLNRLLASVRDKETTVYHYDKLSNIVMEDKGTEIIKYEYNKLNQLTSKKSKEGVTSYTYDKLGNRIREEGSLGVKEYTYDGMGNLTQGVNEKGEVSIYEYSPLGMRTKEISITKGEDGNEKKVTTTYVVDYLGSESSDLVSYAREGFSEVVTRYTYAGGERIGQTVKEKLCVLLMVQTLRTTKYNIHEDIMGSVSYLTNFDDGKVYQKIEYDAWGRPTVKGDEKNIYFEANYTGHSYDEILGMYYAQARFYDPVNKVFMSMDPAGYGSNWYSYCSANPVTYYDPTGLFDEQAFYEQAGEEINLIVTNPLLREEFFVGVGAMALGLIIGAVVPGAMMLIVGAVITSAQYGINYILETEASGEIFSEKELKKRLLRGGIEGLLMGAGGLACVKAAETFSILKPIEDCAAKAKKISNIAKNEAKEIENTVKDARAIGESEVDAVNMAKRWAINGIGNGAVGVVTEYVGGLVEGKSSKEAFREAMNNAPQIMFTSIFMATADTMVQLHVSENCFVEDTPVLTEEGNVNIQDIEEGDLVFAYDEETGEVGYKEVVRLFRNTADELVHITIVTEDGREETITSTLGHPYYVKTEDAFVYAEDLEEGTLLMLADGTTATVVKVVVEKLETPVTVYNFEVKDFHTYYVGDNSVLVHNMCRTGGRGGEQNASGESIASLEVITDMNKKFHDWYKREKQFMGMKAKEEQDWEKFLAEMRATEETIVGDDYCEAGIFQKMAFSYEDDKSLAYEHMCVLKEIEADVEKVIPSTLLATKRLQIGSRDPKSLNHKVLNHERNVKINEKEWERHNKAMRKAWGRVTAKDAEFAKLPEKLQKAIQFTRDRYRYHLERTKMLDGWIKEHRALGVGYNEVAIEMAGGNGNILAAVNGGIPGRGGLSTFQNREKLLPALPKGVTYLETDVVPRETNPGIPLRVVLRSDRKAIYLTTDHYGQFWDISGDILPLLRGRRH